jgi:hypothetical protein
MATKNNGVARRAWNILRLALLWARKGGVFKRRLMMELRQYIRNLGSNGRHDQIHYGERELSFEKTPIFHVKMNRPANKRFHLPNIPCITPQVDFDYDFDGDDDIIEEQIYGYDNGRNSFLKGGDDDEEEFEEMVTCEEDGIDLKAEEFIAKFYQQMKMQRQISYLQYK